jgi:hypothetical protein
VGVGSCPPQATTNPARVSSTIKFLIRFMLLSLLQ